MVINWYGEGCFKILTGGVTILTDPFDGSTGLTPPRLKPDILIKTSTNYPIAYNETGNTTLFGPGAYELKSIEINGWSITSDANNLKTAYLVRAEELSLGFLGHLTAMPEAAILEELGDVDLLFIPAGGPPFITQEAIAKLIKQINPKIVVASFFKIPGLKSKVGDIKEFLKELDSKAEPQEKLVIKKKDLPAKTQVVVLRI